MNVLLSTVGRRGYIAQYFRKALPPGAKIVGTTDRHGADVEFTSGFLFCDVGIVVPSIADSGYVDALLGVCVENDIKVLCSLYDEDSYTLSDHISKFNAEDVVPFISSREVNEICFDKYNTHTFLERNGFGTPATFVSVGDFMDSLLGFPAIIKPRRGCAGIGMIRAENKDQLMAYFKPGAHLIQEVVTGTEYGVDVLNDLEGRVLSSVVKRKLRMRAGETDQAVTVKDTALLSFSVRLAEALGHVGPLDVDLMVSSGGVRVLDLNPRFGGGFPLSYAAGADFVGMMIKLARGERVAPKIGTYKENVVMLKNTEPVTMSLDEANSMANVCRVV